VRARRLNEFLPPGGEPGRVVLEVDDVHLSFAGLKALDGVSFQVHTNELFAIIGPNGAGKTCILNCISGVYHPQQGTVRFEERTLPGMRPDRIANLGIARTFQNIELFPQMTVLDNLMLGRHNHLRYGTLASLVRVGKASREEARNREVVEGLVEFLQLQPVRKSYVMMLPY
jgi:branched-chain amino acid transport system ATP-binding protein